VSSTISAPPANPRQYFRVLRASSTPRFAPRAAAGTSHHRGSDARPLCSRNTQLWDPRNREQVPTGNPYPVPLTEPAADSAAAPCRAEAGATSVAINGPGQRERRETRKIQRLVQNKMKMHIFKFMNSRMIFSLDAAPTRASVSL
jgi:hypothetical protein